MDNNKPYLIPFAIIAAGALIALAVFFRGSTPGTIAPAAVFDIDSVPTLASRAGVGRSDFEQCWDSGKYADKVDAQVLEASSLGAQGTPFPIILTQDGRTIVLPGALPYADLKPLLDEVLSGAASSSYFTTLPNPLPPVTAADHLDGPVGAPITIIEYSDLDCPFCKRFHETMNQVKAEYGDQVAWVYRHLPLLSLHPNAGLLAEATECVAELGGNDKFWDFLDRVFAAH